MFFISCISSSKSSQNWRNVCVFSSLLSLSDFIESTNIPSNFKSKKKKQPKNCETIGESWWEKEIERFWKISCMNLHQTIIRLCERTVILIGLMRHGKFDLLKMCCFWCLFSGSSLQFWWNECECFCFFLLFEV